MNSLTDQQYEEYEKITWDAAMSQARSNIICMESLFTNCKLQNRVYNKRKEYLDQEVNFDALLIQKNKEGSSKNDSINEITLADDNFCSGIFSGRNLKSSTSRSKILARSSQVEQLEKKYNIIK